MLVFLTGKRSLINDWLIKNKINTFSVRWEPSPHLTQDEQIKRTNELINYSTHATDLHIASNNDLVFTSIRLAVKRGELMVEDLRVLFFTDDEPQEIVIDKDGRLPHWPRKFFDAMENLLADMLDWNK